MWKNKSFPTLGTTSGVVTMHRLHFKNNLYMITHVIK